MSRLLALIVVAACGAPTAAPNPPAPQRLAEAPFTYRFEDADRKAKLVAAAKTVDPAIEDEMTKQHVPGLSLGIVVDGELVYAKGYGVADVAARTAPDADTAYRIGSLTKSFTAASVLALRDQGVVTLEDPLVKWVPEAAGLVYPTRDSRPITLHQLLTHTSGLPREYDRSRTATEADITAQLQDLSLEHPPGEVFSYSNLGFVLLSLTVAHASHTTFRELVTQHIFKPLGMTESTFDTSPELAPAYKSDNKTVETNTNAYRLAVGGGGIVSTVRDLSKYVAFELAAYPPRNEPETGPIQRATIRESHTTGYMDQAAVHRRSTDNKLLLNASTYGFGWAAHRTCDDDDLVEHSGAIDSYRSSIRMLTHHGVGVIVLSNFGNAATDNVADRVIDVLRASGALRPYVVEPSLAPGYEAAMKRFLVAYNAPSHAALTDMLARDPEPIELAELTGYHALHGQCTSFQVARSQSPTNATFALQCERGRFEVQTSLVRGKLGGFSGFSRGDATPELQKLATDALSLIDTWDDAVFDRTFDPAGRAVVKAGSAKLHATLGSCQGEVVHEASGWGIDATCTRGTAHLSIVENAGRLTRFLIERASVTATCPVD